MISHISTRTIESKAVPGVRFVIRKMTKRRADALNELQSTSRDQLRVIYEEFTPLDKERASAGDSFPAEKLKRWEELLKQITRIDENEMSPVAMRFCLVRIENLDITYPSPPPQAPEDGPGGVDITEAATLELVTAHGPDELYYEMLHAIKRECGLLPEEAENLSSPSTSAAAVDGNPVNAENVEKQETTILSAA